MPGFAPLALGAAAAVVLAGAERGGVRGGVPAEQRLSGQPNRTAPTSVGCFSIRDRGDCCGHYDLRGDGRYDGQLCTPAASSATFSSGHVCEPECWTQGRCGSGSDQGDAVGACEVEFVQGHIGETCAWQGLFDVSRVECFGAAKDAVGFSNFSTMDTPSYATVASGCIYEPRAYEDAVLYKESFGDTSIGSTGRYICARRAFVATEPAE